MAFSIDPKKHRVIDISHTVVPGEDPGRPFAVQRAVIPADKTFRYDVLLTHTHVGTHIEGPRHFFETGKPISDYPLDYFHGRGILFHATQRRVTRESAEKEISDIVQPGDIVVVRNDTRTRLTKERVYSADDSRLPTLTLSAAEYFLEKKVKMLVLDFVRLGEDVEQTRKFHELLMSHEICFVEIVENLDQITRREFYVMALPYKVDGLDSAWTRAIVIEET
jgi:kynurenine formamidase